MRLKKASAALALLSTLTLLAHMGYCAFAYLTFYYNPALKTLTAIPFALCACAHGVCGMCSVFLLGDGTRLDIYQQLNRRTVIQRISAAFIFPLLLVHVRTFGLLQGFAEAGAWLAFALAILVQVAFFAAVCAHTATSFSRALITLGLLGDRQTQTRLDTVVYALLTAAFLIATFAIVRGELAMFLPR